MFLPQSLPYLSNLSECHLTLLLKFYGVLYEPSPTLGFTLKNVIADPKVFPLNSYSRENKLDLFFQTSAKMVISNIYNT